MLAGKANASTVTAKKAVQYILQQSPDWTLGDFGYTDSNPYKFDGETLFDALETVTDSLADAVWTYDMSRYPFQLNITKRDTSVASEMRAGRNMKTITRTVDTSGMFTRFYPIGKDDLHLPGSGYVEKNAGTYGVIAKCETDNSIETADELRRWANERLAKHCEPTLTIDIDGFELAAATGEPLDKMNLGRVMRVPLAEYGTTITERITELSYADKIRYPEVVKVTLANNRTDVTKIIADAIKNGSGGKGGRTAAKQQKEDMAWFEDTEEHVAMCAKGIVGVDAKGEPNWIRLSQIYVDGNGISQTVTEVVKNQKTYESRLSQNERSIGMVVGKYDDGGNYIKAAEICAAINDDGSSQATIRADHIYLLGETIAEKVSADFIKSRIATIPVLNTRSLSATGTISCSGYVYGDNFVIGSSSGGAGNKYVSNAIEQLQFVTSGTTVWLQKKDFADTNWVNVGSFERATALSGAWSGRKITVSANASNVPDLVNEIRAESSWSGRTVTVKVYAYTATGQLIGDTGCSATETYNLPKTAITLTRQKRTYEPTTDGILSAITSNGWYELEVTAAGVSKTWRVEVNV